MKRRTMFSRLAMTATWIFIPSFALAQNDLLSLKHGTYVLEGSECKEPPFAAMMSWDGIGLSGPHTSKCTSHILSHRGNQFSVSTSCTALGDGTPNSSGQPDVMTISLTRLSNSSFVIVSKTTPQTAFRWCAAK